VPEGGEGGERRAMCLSAAGIIWLKKQRRGGSKTAASRLSFDGSGEGSPSGKGEGKLLRSTAAPIMRRRREFSDPEKKDLRQHPNLQIHRIEGGRRRKKKKEWMS